MKQQPRTPRVDDNDLKEVFIWEMDSLMAMKLSSCFHPSLSSYASVHI